MTSQLLTPTSTHTNTTLTHTFISLLFFSTINTNTHKLRPHLINTYESNLTHTHALLLSLSLSHTHKHTHTHTNTHTQTHTHTQRESFFFNVVNPLNKFFLCHCRMQKREGLTSFVAFFQVNNKFFQDNEVFL